MIFKNNDFSVIKNDSFKLNYNLMRFYGQFLAIMYQTLVNVSFILVYRRFSLDWASPRGNFVETSHSDLHHRLIEVSQDIHSRR